MDFFKQLSIWTQKKLQSNIIWLLQQYTTINTFIAADIQTPAAGQNNGAADTSQRNNQKWKSFWIQLRLDVGLICCNAQVQLP